MMQHSQTGRSWHFWLGFLLLGAGYQARAQTEYQGLRLALFDLDMVKQTGGTISLRCQVANTGRLPVALPGKGQAPFPPLVIELDTLHLPIILREWPGLTQRALLREKIRLDPGEIQTGLLLSIRLQDTLPEAPVLPACTALVIDTAYILRQDERTLLLRFQLRNAGQAPVSLPEGDRALILDAYFISGTKVTRGAILAEKITLKPPRALAAGLLLPGSSVSWEVAVSTKNRSRFSPHLALEFDPLQTLPDCTQSRRLWVIE